MSFPSAISVWPEQKSMSGSAIATAVTFGGPDAGFHNRGSEAEVVPASYLPQASTFPVGRRVMWSGTMSHATGASQAQSLRVARDESRRQLRDLAADTATPGMIDASDDSPEW